MNITNRKHQPIPNFRYVVTSIAVVMVTVVRLLLLPYITHTLGSLGSAG